jgi:hypothetical protein
VATTAGGGTPAEAAQASKAASSIVTDGLICCSTNADCTSNVCEGDGFCSLAIQQK